MKVEIFNETVYFKSIDKFYPRVNSDTASHIYSGDDVVQLSNICIFSDCKCNVSIYTEKGDAFYVDVHILHQTENREDFLASFFRIERKLDKAYGKTLRRHGRISWVLFGFASSKRRISNAVVEHRLYEHFGLCESITVKLS